ncbi:MAG: hypothetical protein JWO17_3174 [Actinomycetia bacterium]|nr:hypothetical protein [Actinomycetes bacterium]
MDTPAPVPAEERNSGTLTYALLAIVLVVAAIFALNSTAVPNHWYGLFKAIHVTFAVLWVGGGAMITILAIVAERANDPLHIAQVARQAATVGEKFFAPVGLVTFLMGLAMMFNTNWGWGKFWVVIGLVGYAATFAIGIGLIAPTVKKLQAMIEAKGPTDPDAIALIKRVMLITRVDSALLLLVVLDMVTKPFS